MSSTSRINQAANIELPDNRIRTRSNATDLLTLAIDQLIQFDAAQYPLPSTTTQSEI